MEGTETQLQRLPYLEKWFVKTHHYDDWTARAQLPAHEKAA